METVLAWGSAALSVVALGLAWKAERRVRTQERHESVQFKGVKKRLPDGTIRVRFTNTGTSTAEWINISPFGLTEYAYKTDNFTYHCFPNDSKDLILRPHSERQGMPDKIHLNWEVRDTRHKTGQTVLLEPDLSDD